MDGWCRAITYINLGLSLSLDLLRMLQQVLLHSICITLHHVMCIMSMHCMRYHVASCCTICLSVPAAIVQWAQVSPVIPPLPLTCTTWGSAGEWISSGLNWVLVQTTHSPPERGTSLHTFTVPAVAWECA